MVTFVPVFISEARRQHGAAEAAEQARLEAVHIGDPKAVEEGMGTWKAANPQPQATLGQVADHIDHVRKVAGVDHVGIGSDFDGIGSTPVGLEDVSCFPALFGELLRRGWKKKEVAKLAGLNLLRVMRRSEEVSKQLRQARPSSDAKY